MEQFRGETLEGVYASYAVTSAATSILRKISDDILATIHDAQNLIDKPEVKIPDIYHMTLDYAGKVEHIDKYVKEIQERKRESSDTTLRFPAMNEWKSNVNGRTIIHAHPSRSEPYTIPFNVREGYNAHLTLADIQNTEHFRLWFILCLDRFVDIRRDVWEESEHPVAIEVDTSKVQIRGKVDGQKQLIVEV